MNRPPLFIVMGVSGCGKSTVGRLLAEKFEIPFFDGDDYHPKENVEKMSNGLPLNDEDRKGWLIRLNLLAQEHHEKGAVIACSALKQSYRDCLAEEIENQIEFVYLEGTKSQILKRLEERKGHFMPAGLLDSQFNTLETPINAIATSIQQTPKEMVLGILKQYQTKKR